jgi:hypothetical protein
MSTRYRPIYNCPHCGMRWKGSAVKAQEGMSPEEDASYRLAVGYTPKCPNLDCGIVNVPRGIDLSIAKAPASIGQNVGIKAIDETAKIVMQDYGMTDLRSDVRPGETAAPKIAPHLQKQADNFFGGGKRTNMPRNLNPALLGRAAIAGAFRQPDNNATTLGGLKDELRPRTNIIADGR